MENLKLEFGAGGASERPGYKTVDIRPEPGVADSRVNAGCRKVSHHNLVDSMIFVTSSTRKLMHLGVVRARTSA